MGDFLEVWRSRGSIMVKLGAMLQARDAAREQEVNAATNIKRVYRGKVEQLASIIRIVRDNLHRKRKAMIRIASIYRGYRGRLRAREAAKVALMKEKMTVYHYHALMLQGLFRGYMSRKYKYNHARRKRYLQEVMDMGDAMRRDLRAHEEAMAQGEAAKAEENKEANLQAVTRNLHHLVSTESIAGVYNSPWMRRTGTVPTIQGVEVETHLTVNTKDLLRSRGYVKRGLEKDLNGQLRVPLRGRTSRRSVQAQGPYNLPEEIAAAANIISRLKRVGPREFRAGNRVPPPPYVRGINKDTEFMDPWQNPYLMRGVPRNQEDLSLPLNQATLGKYPGRPFYTSVGGNKSNVLPNGIFDVILEAEQTGGVLRKRNERTRRYGIPDTCDVDDGVVPGGTLVYPASPQARQRLEATCS